MKILTRPTLLLASLLASFLMSATTAPPIQAAVVKVSIVNFTYVPDTVTINVGDTVLWTSTADHHTVTADNGSFDSSNGTGQTLPLNGTFSHTFATAGKFPYHCQIHGAAGGIGMSGVVIVNSGSTVPAPTITGLSALSGAAGTLVTIRGTNFTGATAVHFGSISASFSLSAPTQIIAVVPPTSTTGAISVTTPGGTARGAIFTATPPTTPMITGFAPAGGTIGSSVTITGTNLSGATAHIGSVLATIKSNTGTALTIIVPPGALSGPISITTPLPTSSTVTSANVFTVAPVITIITPANSANGTIVTIRGTNFTGTTSVRFGGVGAVFLFNSSTQITAVVPLVATGGPVTVTTLAGTGVVPAFSVH